MKWKWVGLALLAQPAAGQPAEQILEAVARIHGAPGIFAVAGYREGQRALKELGSALNVIHYCPLKVQYSCVADGWQAATGVSAGKLSLRIQESDQFHTEVRERATGRGLRFELRPAFVERYLNTPRPDQAAAAREVLEMPDEEIFSVVAQP